MQSVLSRISTMLACAFRTGVLAFPLGASVLMPTAVWAQCVTPVTITSQPGAPTGCVGSNDAFTIAATGSPAPTYQWQKNSVNLANGAGVSGATSNTLVLSAIDLADAGTYRCIVTNACGSVTSNGAVFTVYGPTSITTPPVGQTVCAGDTASLSVVAANALSYRWQKNGVNMSNGGKVSGATTSTLTLTGVDAADAANYRCVVSNNLCFSTATSTDAALVVNTPVAIDTEPVAQTICGGSTLTLAIAATGDPAPTYRWQSQLPTQGFLNMSDGANVSGAFTNTLTVANFSPASWVNYRCRVTNACGTVNTITVRCDTDTPVVITSNPAAQTICPGDTFSFAVAATGTNLSYEWRSGSNAVITDGAKANGTVVSGATTSTITFANAQDADIAANHYVVVSNACGSANSGSAPLTFRNAATITLQPIGQAVCTGGAASLSVAATGANLTYRWRNGNLAIINDGVKANGTVISGATTSTITFSNIDAADLSSFYHADVTGDCGTVSSGAAGITVDPAMAITSQPSGRVVCPRGTASIAVGATGAGLSYRWRNGNFTIITDGVKANGTVVSGATTSTITFSNVNAADLSNFYHADVIGTCGTLSSLAAHISVCAADYNCSGAVSVQDIFDFLAGYFSGAAAADFNGSGVISVQDIFSFLAAYFAGC